MLQVQQVPPLQLQISSEGMINKSISADQINQAVNLRIQHFHEQQRANLLTSSPACYPHFNHYQPNGQWNSTTKFKRIVFYHARKAGGTSTASYLKKVAETHGIDIELQEWRAAEEPGTNKDTFYVTHLREPVDRSISHFKYEGRWSCRALMDKAFVPTKDNAYKLETWNQTTGHSHYNREDECFGTTTLKGPINRNPDPPLDDKWRVHLSECAVNCYTQWFGGLNCARWQVPFEQQYEVALSKLYKYNLIIVIEKLHDPKYAQAIKNFFGVEGILKRGVPPCEKQSHKANGDNPLVVHTETRAKLTELNRLDLKLYNEISDCLADGSYEKIPKWDGSRFLLKHSSPAQVRIYNPWWGDF